MHVSDQKPQHGEALVIRHMVGARPTRRGDVRSNTRKSRPRMVAQEDWRSGKLKVRRHVGYEGHHAAAGPAARRRGRPHTHQCSTRLGAGSHTTEGGTTHREKLLHEEERQRATEVGKVHRPEHKKYLRSNPRPGKCWANQCGQRGQTRSGPASEDDSEDDSRAGSLTGVHKIQCIGMGQAGPPECSERSIAVDLQPMPGRLQ